MGGTDRAWGLTLGRVRNGPKDVSNLCRSIPTGTWPEARAPLVNAQLSLAATAEGLTPAHVRFRHGIPCHARLMELVQTAAEARASRRPVLSAFVVFGAFWGAWAALVPAVEEAIGATAGGLGVALLFLGVGALPAMALVGSGIDRFGGVVLPATLLALAGAALLPAFAGSVPTLAVAMLVVGAASGAADVAINSEVAALEAGTRATLMPLAHGTFSAGVIVGAVSAGAARQLGADRLEILATAAALIAVSAWHNRRPYPRPNDAKPQRRVRRRSLVLLGAVCAVAFVIEGGIENWSALFLERELGAEPAVSALAPAAYALAMVAGRLSGQWLLRVASPGRVLASGAVVSTAALAVGSRAGEAALAICAFGVAGLGIALAAPILFGAAGRRGSDADRGASVATVTTISYLGFLAGPPLVGGTAQAIGLRGSLVLLAAAAAIVAAAAPRLELD